MVGQGITHYIANIPCNGRYPVNWTPVYETLGLDFAMIQDGVETGDAQIGVFEEKNPDYGICIYDFKRRKTANGTVPFSCLLRAPPSKRKHVIVLIQIFQKKKSHFLYCTDFNRFLSMRGEAY